MALSPSTYLAASALIGAAQVAEAIVLIRTGGRVTPFPALVSIVECVWAGVSYFVWRAADSAVPYWLPASFIAYAAAFFAAGVVLAAQSGGKTVTAPAHLAIGGGAFGLYFGAASALCAMAA